MVVPILAGLATGSMQAVTKAGFESAMTAVELAIKLIGVMTLWLGLMKIAEHGGLMKMIARALRPVMRRLFPDVPGDHPAMGAMIMNFAANMLGLGNAATPLGIKAMMELNKLAPVKGQASNAMILFLAVNTSSIALLPLGVIGLRAAAGAENPANILVPGLLATICSTATAVIAGLLFNRARPNPVPAPAMAGEVPDTIANSSTAADDTADHGTTDSATDTVASSTPAAEDVAATVALHNRIVPMVVIALACAAVAYRVITAGTDGLGGDVMRWWLVPIIMLALLLFGYRRGVNVYESACEGGREGFDTAVRIIPFLVMILVAIGMFRASGAFAMLTDLLAPVTSLVGLPADVLPMAILRPLTGSGAFGVLSDLTNAAPNGFSAYLAGIMQGSTETTFYVLAIYFGSVGITRIRHALWPALLADLAGITSSIAFAHIFFN